MRNSTPSIETRSKSHNNKQTGPKTPAGKAQSAKNATKHGLTSRSLVAPWEDPDKYEQFIAAIIESLQPVGAAEEELVRQFASASWKLRRAELWEATQARRQVTNEQQAWQAQTVALDEKIKQERYELSNLQRDPASEPPLVVQVAGMPDASLIYGHQVDFMFRDWIRSLPDGIPRVTLTDLVKRIDKSEAAHGGRMESPKKVKEPEADTPKEVVEARLDEMDWPAARVRKLISEMARVVGKSPEQLVRDVEVQWQGELQDKQVDRRQRRSEVRRSIKLLESQQRDLRVERTMLDTPRLDLLTRYEGSALRMRDKSLRAFLELQSLRMSNKTSRPQKRAKG